MRMCPTNHDPFALIAFHLTVIDSGARPYDSNELGRQHRHVHNLVVAADGGNRAAGRGKPPSYGG
jgi:hypothetical protein